MIRRQAIIQVTYVILFARSAFLSQNTPTCDSSLIARRLLACLFLVNVLVQMMVVEMARLLPARLPTPGSGALLT